MRKINILLFLIIVLSLSGCTKLDNELFENETLNHLDEALEYINIYSDKLTTYYEKNYPEFEDHGDPSILDKPSYIDSSIDSNSFYRHELINYHLTDHRFYKSTTSNDIDIARKAILEIKDFAVTNCNESLKEGKKCTEEGSYRELSFVMENDNIVLDFQNYNESNAETLTYYFHIKTDINNRMILTFHYEKVDEDKENKEKVILYYEEGILLEGSYYELSVHHPEGLFIKTYTDLLKNDYYYQIYTVDEDRLGYFNANEQALYQISKIDDHFANFYYQEFHGNKWTIEYRETIGNFKGSINIMEFPNWDRVDRENVTDDYRLYYGEEEITSVFLTVEVISYEDIRVSVPHIPTIESILFNKFGVSSEYTEDFFIDKRSYIINNFEEIKEKVNFIPYSLRNVFTIEE